MDCHPKLAGAKSLSGDDLPEHCSNLGSMWEENGRSICIDTFLFASYHTTSVKLIPLDIYLEAIVYGVYWIILYRLPLTGYRRVTKCTLEYLLQGVGQDSVCYIETEVHILARGSFVGACFSCKKYAANLCLLTRFTHMNILCKRDGLLPLLIP